MDVKLSASISPEGTLKISFAFKKEKPKDTKCKQTVSGESEKKKRKVDDDSKPQGFDRGLEAEKISATDASGELMFLIK
ncbi:chromobox protein 1-like protein, partial [Dinothrombium tinctorium]